MNFADCSQFSIKKIHRICVKDQKGIWSTTQFLSIYQSRRSKLGTRHSFHFFCNLQSMDSLITNC